MFINIKTLNPKPHKSFAKEKVPLLPAVAKLWGSGC